MYLNETFTTLTLKDLTVWSKVTKEIANQPSINQPTNQPTNQSTNQLTTQSTNQPPNQPTNQPTNQPASQPAGNPNTIHSLPYYPIF
jgi:hypothetical protein